MEAVQYYPPSEASQHTHTTQGPFSPLSIRPTYPASTTFSEFSATSNQSPPVSPTTKYATTATSARSLPPATDSLINSDPQQPSLTARLHRRKKTYKGPTAPATNYSAPNDGLRAARLAWRLQEEHAEQVRLEREQMRASSASFQRQQRELQAAQQQVRTAGPMPSRPRTKKKAVRSKWTAFVVWFKLSLYRFTRGLKSIFH